MPKEIPQERQENIPKVVKKEEEKRPRERQSLGLGTSETDPFVIDD